MKDTQLQPSDNRYTAISLFTGAGGLDIGFERAGFEIVFANEINPDAASTWMANRPGSTAMHQGDINSYIDIIAQYRGIDVVFGGPPCQGFSVAGKMDPRDPRSALVWSFLDVIEKTMPAVFIIENVRALGVLSKWSLVRKGIIDRADGLGYSCTYDIYSASDFGVPQNRERVIFVGVRNGIEEKRPFSECMDSFRRRPRPLRQVLLEAGRYGTDENPQTCTSHVSLATNPVMRQSPYAGMLVNGAGRPMNLDGAALTLPASMGGNKTPIVDQQSLESGTENWFVGYHRRLIEGETPGIEIVPSTLRRLTIKEASMLQTFPDDYIFCGKKTQQYKQIGNAVAADFATAVAQSVKTAYLQAQAP